jgi:hypothetical protein
MSCRHKTADLRHDRNQGILPQESRLARHVGTGQQPQWFAFSGQIAVIGCKSPLALRHQGRFDNRMPSLFDNKGIARINHRAHIAPRPRDFGKSQHHIKFCKRRRDIGNLFTLRHDENTKGLEQIKFHRNGARCGNGDFLFQFRKFDG